MPTLADFGLALGIVALVMLVMVAHAFWQWWRDRRNGADR